MNIYCGSNGCYYTDWDIWQRFECGEWVPQMWDTETMWELVESASGEVILLMPLKDSLLPEGVRISEADQPTIEDARSTSNPDST